MSMVGVASNGSQHMEQLGRQFGSRMEVDDWCEWT